MGSARTRAARAAPRRLAGAIFHVAAAMPRCTACRASSRTFRPASCAASVIFTVPSAVRLKIPAPLRSSSRRETRFDDVVLVHELHVEVDPVDEREERQPWSSTG